MLTTIFNFVISQSLRKQTSMRWSLVLFYLILIFPAMILMSMAQSMEKNQKQSKSLQQSSWKKFIYYTLYFSPTMFLSCAISIAAIGSTFAAWIPLFWFIIVLLLIFGYSINYYLFTNNSKKDRNKKKR